MSGFRVQLDALRQASQGIDGLLQNVQAVGPGTFALSAEVLGHAGLAESVGAFASRWDVGIDALAGDGRTVADRLRRCADAYARVDENVAGGLVQGSADDPGAD